MREKLKPCPFCGINDWRYHAYFSGIKIRKCGECGIIVDESTINTRLIEDDLRKRIAELEKAYRWISTTENPPPEDKRFVLAVNATNGKTYYFVLPDLNDSSDNAG